MPVGVHAGVCVCILGCMCAWVCDPFVGIPIRGVYVWGAYVCVSDVISRAGGQGELGSS